VTHYNKATVTGEPHEQSSPPLNACGGVTLRLGCNLSLGMFAASERDRFTMHVLRGKLFSAAKLNALRDAVAAMPDRRVNDWVR
jgi:hypothetical protein